MAKITPSDLVVPSLLDRLTSKKSGRSGGVVERTVTIEQQREYVRRDLSWLLNSGSLDRTVDLSDYPHVAKSVLNYGWRDLAGQHISDDDIPSIKRSLRDAILAFEPRLRPETLKVRATNLGDEEDSLFMRLAFEIEGDLVSDPVAFHIVLKAGMDLNSGEVLVREVGG